MSCSHWPLFTKLSKMNDADKGMNPLHVGNDMVNTQIQINQRNLDSNQGSLLVKVRHVGRGMLSLTAILLLSCSLSLLSCYSLALSLTAILLLSCSLSLLSCYSLALSLTATLLLSCSLSHCYLATLLLSLTATLLLSCSCCC